MEKANKKQTIRKKTKFSNLDPFNCLIEKRHYFHSTSFLFAIMPKGKSQRKITWRSS
jgi:hypothetical protein